MDPSFRWDDKVAKMTMRGAGLVVEMDPSLRWDDKVAKMTMRGAGCSCKVC